jgi:hypothetical protein
LLLTFEKLVELFAFAIQVESFADTGNLNLNFILTSIEKAKLEILFICGFKTSKKFMNPKIKK